MYCIDIEALVFIFNGGSSYGFIFHPIFTIYKWKAHASWLSGTPGLSMQYILNLDLYLRSIGKWKILVGMKWKLTIISSENICCFVKTSGFISFCQNLNLIFWGVLDCKLRWSDCIWRVWGKTTGPRCWFTLGYQYFNTRISSKSLTTY